MAYKSTREVARVLGINPSRLSRAVWTGRLQEPQRGPSGNFLWTEKDIRRASWALLHRDLDGLLADGQKGGSDV